MSDGSKQFMAWTMAIALSGTVYGGGAYWLKKATLLPTDHDEQSAHHDEEHEKVPGHADGQGSPPSHQAENEHANEHHDAEPVQDAPAHGEATTHEKAHGDHESSPHDVAHKKSNHDDATGESQHPDASHASAQEPNSKAHHSDSKKQGEHGSPRDEKTADKNTHSTPQWTYTKNDPNGPANWGDLAKQFATCEKGMTQSPIDLSRAVPSKIAPKILWHYGSAKVTVENNGHTIQSNMTDGKNHITIDNEIYNLAQFHFHAPSEHRISGIPSDLELHFVHKNASGGLAVIGVMLNELAGRENKSFKPVWDIMPRDLHTKATHPATISLTSLLPSGRQYFHYQGSLTTPPCSEGVRWFVLRDPLTISSGQIEMYSSIFGGPTNRPVQPLQGREIITNGSPALAH